MNSFVRNTLCAAAFAGGIIVVGAGAASADTGTQQHLASSGQTSITSASTTANRDSIASNLGLGLGANLNTASTLEGTSGGNTTGTNRGTYTTASNLGLDLGADLNTASTLQNTSGGNTTGVLGR